MACSAWLDINRPKCRKEGDMLGILGAAHRKSLNVSWEDFIASTFLFQCFLFAKATFALNLFARMLRLCSSIASWYSKCANLHSWVHQVTFYPLCLLARLPTAFKASSEAQYKS